MKLFKSLTTIAFLMVSLNAFAGREGGGGQIIPLQRVPQKEFTSSIKQNAFVLEMVFKALENDIHGTLRSWTSIDGLVQNYPEYDFAKKAFSGPQNVYEVLQHFVGTMNNYDFIVNGDCVDPLNSAKKDGSFSGTGLNGTICLSANRVTAKTNGVTALNQGLALIAHEIGHLAGLNETETTHFQLKVLELLVNDSPAYWANLNHTELRTFEQYEERAVTVLDLRKKAHSEKDYIALCQRVTDLYTRTPEIMVFKTLLRPETEPTIWLTASVIENLFASCKDEILLDNEKAAATRYANEIKQSFGQCGKEAMVSPYCNDTILRMADEHGMKRIRNIRDPQALLALKVFTKNIKTLFGSVDPYHSDQNIRECEETPTYRKDCANFASWGS